MNRHLRIKKFDLKTKAAAAGGNLYLQKTFFLLISRLTFFAGSRNHHDEGSLVLFRPSNVGWLKGERVGAGQKLWSFSHWNENKNHEQAKNEKKAH